MACETVAIQTIYGTINRVGEVISFSDPSSLHFHYILAERFGCYAVDILPVQPFSPVLTSWPTPN
jgi:hypothetical protein